MSSPTTEPTSPSEEPQTPSIPPPQPPAELPATPPAPARGLPNSDLDRARRFAEWLDGDARHIVQFNQWVVWTDEGWEMDPSGKNGNFIFQKSAEFADALMEEADGYPIGPPQLAAQVLARKAFSKDAMTSMISLLKSFPEVTANPNDFDNDPWLLGVKNGVLNLKSGAFREAQRDDMVIKSCSVGYDPDAKCPMWMKFLEQVIPDKEVRDFIQRAIGYMLTGFTTEQLLFFFYGTGMNGKSTFIEVIEKLLADYHWHTNASMFLEDRSGEAKDNAFASLPQMRLVVGAEMPEHSRLAENRVKDLTGGDTILARKLYCEAFNFKPTHKLLIYGNYKPIVSGTDVGIWRRIIVIPFDVKVAEADRDRGIVDRLGTEKEGILNWALEGCRLWQKEKGLHPPKSVISATREYQEAEDLVLQFVESQCELTGEISTGALASNFKDWMTDDQGFKWSPSPRAVGERIRRIPGVNVRRSNGVRFWTGISMKDPNAYRAK